MSQIKLSENFIKNTVKLALNEDLYPSGDITSSLIKNNKTIRAKLIANEDAIIGGLSGVHQFVHIGKYAMIGGMSGVESNIIPYGLYIGIRDNLRGLNLIGLKRKKVDIKTINKVKEIFRKIFCEPDSLEKNIKNLNQEEKSILEVAEILDFISLNLKRGICRYVND